MKTLEEAQKLTNKITNFVNTFNYDETSELFNEAMSREHRTLQQNFTRLALQWIEYVASNAYRHDGRNKDSHTVASNLIEEFSQFVTKKYELRSDNPSKQSLKLPSNWLGTV